MVRDDLYITVPSFFRCPISLDVMKSPVSLCTGVTYDRSSIQRWLDDGNNTCPATMQVLHTKEFVPNRTLQRLIQIWSDSVQRRVDSPESSPPKPLLSQDQVLGLIRRLDRHSDSSFDSLSKIVCFARDSDENRRFLTGADGFVPTLVELLANAGDGASRSLDLAELAVRALDMIRSEIADTEKLAKSMLKQSHCLRSLVRVLQRGSVESRIGSARILEAIAVDAESKLIIAEKEEVLQELLKLISPEKDRSLMEAGLSCLIAVSMARRVKVKLVNLGAVKSLGKCLAEQNLSVSMTERVLRLLERVSSVKEGVSEICGSERECVVERVVQRLMKVSSAATEHAVTVLWSVCYVHRNRAAQEAVVKANGVTKILLLMQTNCSPAVRQMSADLLKIFRLSSSNSTSFISSYDTNTTHITPF